MPDDNRELLKRSGLYPEELWTAARRAAAICTARTGEKVSINDLQRWGLYRQIQAVKEGSFGPPDGFNR